MDPSCLVSTVQAADGGVIISSFKRNSLPAYCCWPCPSLHDYSVHIFWCYFQQDNAPCHKAQIISDWFLEHGNEFTLLKWPPQSPDLNPIEHFGMWWNGRFASWMCMDSTSSRGFPLSFTGSVLVAWIFRLFVFVYFFYSVEYHLAII